MQWDKKRIAKTVAVLVVLFGSGCEQTKGPTTVYIASSTKPTSAVRTTPPTTKPATAKPPAPTTTVQVPQVQTTSTLRPPPAPVTPLVPRSNDPVQLEATGTYGSELSCGAGYAPISVSMESGGNTNAFGSVTFTLTQPEAGIYILVFTGPTAPSTAGVIVQVDGVGQYQYAIRLGQSEFARSWQFQILPQYDAKELGIQPDGLEIARLSVCFKAP
jgi:hypothetical protein